MSDATRRRIEALPPEKRRLLEARLAALSNNAPLASMKLPRIAPDPQHRYEPFPLTPLQQAYWVGRAGAFEIGNVGSTHYDEFEFPMFDVGRFERAANRLLARHDMLRAVIRADGTQQVLANVPRYQLPIIDLRGVPAGEAERRLLALRAELSHQVLSPERWPVFDIRVVRLDEERVRLLMTMDFTFIDGRSIEILRRELMQLYLDPDATLPELELTFRDYVLAEQALGDSPLFHAARDYWQKRAPTLALAPELPMARDPGAIAQPRFVRHTATLDRALWTRLKTRARAASLTPSALMCAAYAEVLGAWSRRPQFTINLTTFNRLPLHPQINHVIGDFTTVTLLEADTSLRGTFASRAQELQRQLWNDLQHRHYSGVNVIRDLVRAGRVRGRQAVMPVVFTSTLPLAELDEGLRGTDDGFGESVYTIGQTPQTWLDNKSHEVDGVLVCIWDAVVDLFPPELIGEMFAAYEQLLRRLAAEDETAWHSPARELLPAPQRERREAANATAAPVPTGLLHGPFTTQARARADQPAVIDATRVVTYGELQRVANRIARRLRDRGVRPNELVAVVLEKGWEQVAAVLGVLASGGAYMPVDPSLPAERFERLLCQGEARFALTVAALDGGRAWPDGVERVRLDELPAGPDDEVAPEPVQSPDDLAYVIFTSGSTGQPKGVMIDHRGALNTVVDVNQRFGVSAADRVLALSALSFDLSVYDIFGVLAAGGALVIPEPSLTRDPAHWLELVRRHDVTLWNSVPALMQLLIEYAEGRPADGALDTLRLVMMSGDWIPVTLPARIRARAPAARVVSLGGATEASIWSILYPIETVDPNWKSIPYGKPMLNQTFHVLNDAMEPSPDWVTGQLCIGGVGLAKGYWRNDEETRKRFVAHPRTGAQLYRTGDLGRYLPDGNIEFLGREDFQVKVAGHRIELGEIEVALEQHPTVRSAVAAAVGPAGGIRRLIAYVVPAVDQPFEPDALRAHLASKLPEYMVPRQYVRLSALPLSANGKVDRALLPAPSESAGAQGAAGAQAGGGERAEEAALAERVMQVVRSVLKTDDVTAETDLVALGATSVDLVRIVNALERELGTRPDLRQVFAAPTVTALVAHHLAARRKAEVGAAQPDFAHQQFPAGPRPARPVLVDPAEREAFKQRQLALRTDGAARARVPLPAAELDEHMRRHFATRRTERAFGREPLALSSLASLLAWLRRVTLDGEPRYGYPSASGLYPVQAYVQVQPGRVDGLAAGLYYFHPVECQLVALAPDARLEEPHVAGTNRAVAAQAAFAVLLVAQLDAIEPLYGPASWPLCLLEAGAMLQLLTTEAAGCGIGLCPIEQLDWSAFRPHIAGEGDSSHALLHTVLGGRLLAPGDWDEGTL